MTKYHKLGDFKVTEIHSFTILEASSLKSKVPKGWFLLLAVRENTFPISLPASGDRILWTLGIPWSEDATLQPLPLYSHHILLCILGSFSFLSLLRILSLDFEPILIQGDLILNLALITCALFQIRSYSKLLDGHEFGRGTTQPSTLHILLQFCLLGADMLF